MTGVGSIGRRWVGGLRAAAAVLLGAPLTMLAVLVPGTPAAAHAAMVTAQPAPDSILGASPTDITVTFSEAIRPVTGKVQVLAPDGKRISGTPNVRGAVLHIPVHRADQPLGTYLVSYRVISADSHPVSGALTFSVGAPSVRPPQAPTNDVHPSVAVAFPVARYLGYTGLVLAIGPTLLLALLWPRRVSRRGPIRLVHAGLGLIGVSAAAAIWLQAPYSSGAPPWRVSGTELGAVLGSLFGGAMTARLAILAVIAALLPPVLRGSGGGRRAGLLLVLTVGGLVTWPLTGHAAAASLAPVAVAADVLHLAAMGLWLGGLVTLAAFLLRAAHPRVLGVILPAWSRWATISVGWLIGGGAVQAVLQLGSVGSLLTTGYGRLLLAKIAILALVLGAAAYARRLVHRAPVPAAGRLRRMVGIEIAATTVVLGLSAVLVQTTPARDAAAQIATAEQGVSQTLSCPQFTLQFNIYPVQVGDNNTVHAFVYTPQGSPLPAVQWSVTTLLTDHGLEPVTAAMLALSPPHHAVGAITFPLPGVYEVRFTVRTSDIDQASVKTTLTVR